MNKTDSKVATKEQKFIAWCEISALLHDIGKLSSVWLDYRRKWQDPNNTGGPNKEPECWDYNNDPHTNEFFLKYDLPDGKDNISVSYKSLWETIRKYYPPASYSKIDSTLLKPLTLEVVANKHECCIFKPDANNKAAFVNPLLFQLKLADSIDSAWDRNNPLFCREQKQEGLLFDTEVFGHESSEQPPHCDFIGDMAYKDKLADNYLWGAPPKPHKVNPDCLDVWRDWLYKYLNNNNKLGKYLENPESAKRIEILGAIRYAFDQGMADTTRPGNDTTLWEHTYSVAALFKAAVLNYANNKTGEYYKDFSEFKFGLLGIGWNGLAYMANVPRLGDGLARHAVIKEIIKQLREEIEWNNPLGSLVYWDTNQVVFLVPEYIKAIDDTVKKSIKDVFRTKTHGELFPVMELKSDVFSLTAIAQVIDKLRQKRHIPVQNLVADDTKTLDDYWNQDKDENEKKIDGKVDICPVCKRHPINKKIEKRCKTCAEICPVCRLRPVVSDKTDNRCYVCYYRLKDLKKESWDDKGILFLSEIARGNDNPGFNRLALVVVHFGMHHWLDGRMHRTLMVTERDGIELEVQNLEKINGFKFSDVDKEKQDSKKDTLRKKLRTDNSKPSTYDYSKLKNEVSEYVMYCKAIPKELDKEKARQWVDNNIDKKVQDSIYATMFIYGRRNETEIGLFLISCGNILDQFKKDYCDNTIPAGYEEAELLTAALCTKTPTPSTMLDTWHAPYRFIRELGIIADSTDNELWLNIIKKTKHPEITIEIIDNKISEALKSKLAYKCVANSGKTFEFYFPDTESIDSKTAIVINGDETVKNSKSDDLYEVFGSESSDTKLAKIKFTLNEDKPYLPVREVLLSPELGMFLVPADKAFDVAKEIGKRYSEEFGKVRGRLPFNIGLLYFQSKHPIYLVLDAARRMVEEFEKKDANSTVTATVLPREEACGVLRLKINKNKSGIRQNGEGRIIPFPVDDKLGNGETDYHHPYMIVQNGNGVTNRPSYFKTVGFNKALCGIVHAGTDICGGDIVEFAPSGFDFEYLESIESRHAIAYDTSFLRNSKPFCFKNKPYYLEELPLFDAWRNRLLNKKGAGTAFFGRTPTITEIRSFENLWISKLLEWEVDLSQQKTGSFLQWKMLVETSIKDTFPAFRKEPMRTNMVENYNAMVEAATNGLLLDVLQLVFHIQKEKKTDE